MFHKYLNNFKCSYSISRQNSSSLSRRRLALHPRVKQNGYSASESAVFFFFQRARRQKLRMHCSPRLIVLTLSIPFSTGSLALCL